MSEELKHTLYSTITILILANLCKVPIVKYLAFRSMLMLYAETQGHFYLNLRPIRSNCLTPPSLPVLYFHDAVGHTLPFLRRRGLGGQAPHEGGHRQLVVADVQRRLTAALLLNMSRQMINTHSEV